MGIDTHSIIIATGANSIWLDIPGEYELRGNGVSSCAVCDGFLYSNQDVLIVGGGDSAMEDALVLARTSRHVTVIHRRDTFRASKVLADRVLNHPNIDVQWNTTVQRILNKKEMMTMTKEDSNSDDKKKKKAIKNRGVNDDDDSVQDLDEEDSKEEEVVDVIEDDDDAENVAVDDAMNVVSGAVVRDVTTGEERTLRCNALFVAIGHKPNTDFLQNIVEFDTNHPGYLKTYDVSTTQTSVPGIFAAGDVSDPIYRQAITSAGRGASAALDAERYLSENNLGNEATEFEAELMAEFFTIDDPASTMTGERRRTAGESGDDDDEPYNVYQDMGGRVHGVKESLA